MTAEDLDLTTTRVIRAPRRAVWNAWADPAQLSQWWIPAPILCRIDAFDLRPGGAFQTWMSEDGGETFTAHLDACFLAADEAERIVFTNMVTSTWRPAERGFITAIMTFADHPDGTLYSATALHKNGADRDRHLELGFEDGWGTVAAQLAALVES